MKTGDKVIFYECSDDQANWASCPDPRKFLVIGGIYKVDRIEVHSRHTQVFLEGINADEERGFNSACFRLGQK